MNEESPAIVERGLQVCAIIRPTHPEIREVVKEMTEQKVAVPRVCTSIKNVSMPEFVDRTCRANFSISINNIKG
jgi:hypothetical protein